MRAAEPDGRTQIRGKCQYWRELVDEFDRWDPDMKVADRRVTCSCFIEGRTWPVTVSTVPNDCPDHFTCRYYVRVY